MGAYDFTYQLPENFEKRVIQFLQQTGKNGLIEAFQRCKYEYEDVGLAYYAGLKGDNWDKHALDFTFEGLPGDISILQSANSALSDAVEKALRPSSSGLLVRKMYYLDSDVSFELAASLSSNEERFDVDVKTANCVLDDLIQIGERLCLNQAYNAESSENNINDFFRDMLFAKGYSEVKDQTRHGISKSGQGAGEVDILLSKGGKEIAIFEGLKLSSVNTTYIDEHITKSIVNYNALGTATFVVAYVSSADFEAFWDRYFTHLQKYAFPLQVKRSIAQTAYPNAATRTASAILARDGFDFPVFFLAFKIV